MRDRFHPYPTTISQEILQRGLDEPLLRDEIYVQLIKQTTMNPNPRSLLLGWKLIYLCLLTFAPEEDDTRKCLLSHIAEIANPNMSKYVGLDTAPNVASNCYMALEQLLRAGPPKTMLSVQQITDITVRLFEK